MVRRPKLTYVAGFAALALSACGSTTDGAGGTLASTRSLLTTSDTSSTVDGGAQTAPTPPSPPAEAFAACQTSVEGASCTVQMPARTMEGNCGKGPGSSASLACAPAKPPTDLRPPPPPHGAHGGPHGGPPQEAISACSSLAEGASCSAQMPARSLAGTCRKGPDGSSALACMPAHPGARDR